MGEGQAIKADCSEEEPRRAGTRMMGCDFTRVNPGNIQEIHRPTVLPGEPVALPEKCQGSPNSPENAQLTRQISAPRPAPTGRRN